jgi:hypothetical protein
MRLAEFEIDGFDVADVAIIDFFVMVILDLRDFVADGKGRPEFLDLWVSSRIESPLQLDIQGTGSVPVACPYLVRVPTRVGREAIMKQVEATQILDVEMLSEIASQFGCGDEMKAELDMAPITELDFATVSAIIVLETARFLNRIYGDGGSAAHRPHCGYEVP